MNLHNVNEKKAVKRKTVLSIMVAAGICSLLLAVSVVAEKAPLDNANSNIVAEMP